MSNTSKRKIWISITIIVIAVLGLWVNSRWHAWFYNPEEEAYSPLDKPGRIMLTFGDENELSRNISWQYDSVACNNSFVELVDTLAHDTSRIDAQGEVFQSRNGKMTYYVAKLRQLKSGKVYSYRVHNAEKHSDWYYFSTQNTTPEKFAFMFVGDIQDTIGGTTNELLRNALQKNKDAEFLVCGGDLTERPTDKDWQQTFTGLDSISQSMPILSITGNHDYLKYPIRKLERRFSLVFSYFLDSKINDNQVYTLKYNNIQIFCLDSNREFFFLWKQKKWLENELKNSDAKWKIVVIHHPIFSAKSKSRHKAQRNFFNPLFEEYGVDLVLQGHEHTYARMTSKNENGEKATPIYTISHCSPKCYNARRTDIFDFVNMEGRYYQMIRTNNDTLSISTYSIYDHTLIDSVAITNTNGTKSIR